MTAMVHEPPTRAAEILLESFHDLETPEGFRAELIEGEIVVSPPPGGAHEMDLWCLVRQVTLHSSARMDYSGHKGLKLRRGGRCPKNHIIPDGVFIPHELDLLREADPWMEPEGVALVVEVTSSRPDGDRRDKRHCYAKGGIPLYLLIDRERRMVSLFSEPRSDAGKEDYLQVTQVIFGKPLDLPEPFSFTLDTSELD
ncbi:Endonuclease, Uma2 family (restriction endonuclease fold) [Thermomonospora echinospora]|uniref:Endonuclease, Uma2 family (Restriction endonuclease fold) n=1 Tax=Thermomonospora echinospora TaxID=1992 RepID=A0A1H5YVK6_9ACTN|nr:Uma2 family endonuclease [Thermomonospora echinospora]SEG28048.1 Endonuclease, Uma2 family (restriction endonuclease fold) [Thermomonospora echinospora]